MLALFPENHASFLYFMNISQNYFIDFQWIAIHMQTTQSKDSIMPYGQTYCPIHLI